jgi:methionyl-tRNA formyltransferase
VVETAAGTAVVTGQGLIHLLQVQLAGKKAVAIDEFLRGQPGFLSATLTK